MTDCTFVNGVCVTCGYVLPLGRDKLRRNCPPLTARTAEPQREATQRLAVTRPDTHCQHLGELLRTESCKPCGGRREVQVYQCAIHGECTLYASAIRRQDGTRIKACTGCSEYAGQQV